MEYLLRLANNFGIDWFLLADNDNAGQEKVETAMEHLNGRKPENQTCLLDHGNMELFLSMNGFGHIYEETVANLNKQKITLDKSNGLDYWKQIVNFHPRGSKVEDAIIVAEEITRKGEPAVPQLLKEAIEKVVKLARGTE